jgi:thiamine-phosphate pyrophosphorylase
MVQYRDKHADRSRRLREAYALASVCRSLGATFIVNDDVELALAVKADGVHIGRDDPPISAARDRLGRESLVGVSCYNLPDRALAAQAEGADYVAFGSFFPSRTKPAAVRATVGMLTAARGLLQVPIVVIGGITPENGAELIAAGADIIAVSHGIFGAPDPHQAATEYARLFSPDPAKGRHFDSGVDHYHEPLS